MTHAVRNQQVTNFAAIIVFALCTALIGFAEDKSTTATIPQGTPVMVRLKTALSSANSQTGDRITLEAIEDVKINDALLISRGALVMGHITKAQNARRLGKGGTLAIELNSIKAVDGSSVPVVASRMVKGKGGVGVGTGIGMGATVVLFWPATPLWLLKHGHDTEIPYGTIITLEVAENRKIDLVNAQIVSMPLRSPVIVAQRAEPQEHVVLGETVSGPAKGTPQESLGDAARRFKTRKQQHAN